MPKHAPPVHVLRRNAICRKGALEASLVFESEAVPDVNKAETARSPVSITAPYYQPEIQPLTLPGAWTVVGKGGRPLKDQKLYDEPKMSKKKKKKARSRKATSDAEPLVALEEAPSSSKCYERCSRSAERRAKEVTRAREAKYWARYRHEKAVKLSAHEMLDETLIGAFEDLLSDDSEPASTPPKPEKPRRSNKANSHAERTRRAKRRTSAAARCYSLEGDDCRDDDTKPEPAAQPTKAASQLDTSAHIKSKDVVSATAKPSSSDFKRKAPEVSMPLVGIEKPTPKMAKQRSAARQTKEEKQREGATQPTESKSKKCSIM